MKDDTHPIDSNAITLVQEEVPEGGATFTLTGVNDKVGHVINWGMEICLDHAVSGGWNVLTQNYNKHFGRLRNADKYVRIQLVPSAGMALQDASIRLEPGVTSTSSHAYAINCDGLNNLHIGGYGCHTQIWNDANGAPVPLTNKLFETSADQACANTTVQTLPTQVTTRMGNVAATKLWSMGAGTTRVFDSLPL
jgi:hypothetical protein